MMFFLVFLGVIRVDGMRHVRAYEEATLDGPVVVLASECGNDSLHDALSGLNDHAAVGSNV